MHICLFAASLAGGGAERALLNTGALLAGRGHRVTVVTLESTVSDGYAVPAALTRVALGFPQLSGNRLRGLVNNIRRIVAVRRVVRRLRPDVVISYLTRANVICLLALMGASVPLVVTEHNHPMLRDAPLRGFWSLLRRLTYPRAERVVVVSGGLARHYGWVRPDRLSVIYNFPSPEPLDESETFWFFESGVRYVVAAGRLQSVKQFDSLIRAFQLIEGDCRGWKLLILGEGALRESLTALAASLGLADRVVLPGWVSQPRTVFRRCSIYALSSESEGFPLVLVEAMSSGLPVVSFDIDFGPREIVTHGESGLLIPPDDVPALAQGVLALIRDEALRRRMAARAVLEAERFAPETILAQWEALLAATDRGGRLYGGAA